MPPQSPKANLLGESGLFRTTHWSVVLNAGDLNSPEATASLATLCQTYWYPLYCCVRRHGYSPDDAKDLTQAFFEKLLTKNQIALADPERGRFRTFLLRALENFLRNEYRDRETLKRGGDREIVSLEAEMAEERYAEEPPDQLSPAAFYERQWASTLLERVLNLLRSEFTASGRSELFVELEPHLWGDDTSTPHARIGELLGMTAVAVRVTLHRLRQRYHELLRAEIANTLGNPNETEDELRHLRQVLAS
jgi:RNA polymerase sigma-70 factor (ECF subfamily)